MRYFPVCLVSLWLAVSVCHVARAEIAGSYDLVGKFQLSASVKGKSAKVVNKALGGGRVSALFTQDKQCLIETDAFDIAGVWASKKRSFKTQLTLASVNGLLRGIENDLLAKSGMAVLIMDPDLMTLTGSEQKNGSVKGRLKIKARTLLLDYDNAFGQITLTYDFVGSKLQAVAAP